MNNNKINYKRSLLNHLEEDQFEHLEPKWDSIELIETANHQVLFENLKQCASENVVSLVNHQKMKSWYSKYILISHCMIEGCIKSFEKTFSIFEKNGMIFCGGSLLKDLRLLMNQVEDDLHKNLIEFKNVDRVVLPSSILKLIYIQGNFSFKLRKIRLIYLIV